MYYQLWWKFLIDAVRPVIYRLPLFGKMFPSNFTTELRKLIAPPPSSKS